MELRIVRRRVLVIVLVLDLDLVPVLVSLILAMIATIDLTLFLVIIFIMFMQYLDFIIDIERDLLHTLSQDRIALILSWLG